MYNRVECQSWFMEKIREIREKSRILFEDVSR